MKKQPQHDSVSHSVNLGSTLSDNPQSPMASKRSNQNYSQVSEKSHFVLMPTIYLPRPSKVVMHNIIGTLKGTVAPEPPMLSLTFHIAMHALNVTGHLHNVNKKFNKADRPA